MIWFPVIPYTPITPITQATSRLEDCGTLHGFDLAFDFGFNFGFNFGFDFSFDLRARMFEHPLERVVDRGDWHAANRTPQLAVRTDQLQNLIAPHEARVDENIDLVSGDTLHHSQDFAKRMAGA